jgi:leucyl aminopeptidase
MTATPTKLAELARGIARGSSRITAKILDPKQIKKMSMGGLLAVAAGSDQPCRFIHLSYRAPGAKRTIALVGKGLTYDSGGLCLKPAQGLVHMKVDMAGGAAVLGTFSAIAEVKPKVHVHGIVPATENMSGGSAYKPGDVLRAMNGKTIEVINTDAEGRLILADALCYASKLRPAEILDMATLTGACAVALGPKITGAFGTDGALADRIIRAGRLSGEKIWRMPLEEEYEKLLKSEVADVKHTGGRLGGAITAALFLKGFVDESISWLHLDIAGKAFGEKADHYDPPGGTGVMVRTMLRYLLDR